MNRYKHIVVIFSFCKLLKKISIKFVLVSGLLFVQAVSVAPVQANNQQWRLSEEQWDLIKQGEQLLINPVMQEVVDAWSSNQHQVIELHYPGGEEGELWVRELRDWLISLAIPSQYLFVVAGSGEAGVIIIKIIKVGDL